MVKFALGNPKLEFRVLSRRYLWQRRPRLFPVPALIGRTITADDDVRCEGRCGRRHQLGVLAATVRRRRDYLGGDWRDSRMVARPPGVSNRSSGSAAQFVAWPGR